MAVARVGEENGPGTRTETKTGQGTGTGTGGRGGSFDWLGMLPVL